ncbi:hypothetical protein ACIPYS_39465 [Kitasatospora sp. NPDC089913]|uniref:hypothetical protein n=1 Tax=Kitasatospora sp. NPDC089913 TaxID=3364080 RepID=UPI0037FA013C
MTMTAEAWSAPERQIWEGYAARLAELREHPWAKAVLAHAQLEFLAAGPLEDIRVSDLSVAIFHLENALADNRVALPDLALMEPDDVRRHPGFDGVEDDSVAEEERLLSLREALRGV